MRVSLSSLLLPFDNPFDNRSLTEFSTQKCQQGDTPRLDTRAYRFHIFPLIIHEYNFTHYFLNLKTVITRRFRSNFILKFTIVYIVAETNLQTPRINRRHNSLQSEFTNPSQRIYIYIYNDFHFSNCISPIEHAQFLWKRREREVTGNDSPRPSRGRKAEIRRLIG